MLPFLQKNKVFIFFNQKVGLEHFSAIGIFFGPHPELTWRQNISDRVEKTIAPSSTDSTNELAQWRTMILILS
jgi:hypothetical protein